MSDKKYLLKNNCYVININRLKNTKTSLWDKMSPENSDDDYYAYYLLVAKIDEDLDIDEEDIPNDNEMKLIYNKYKNIPEHLLLCKYNKKHRYFYECSHQEFSKLITDFSDELKHDRNLNEDLREDIYLAGLCHLANHINTLLLNLKPYLKPALTTLEYLNQKVKCECGATLSYVNRKRHETSKQHLLYEVKKLGNIENMENMENTKENIKE